MVRVRTNRLHFILEEGNGHYTNVHAVTDFCGSYLWKIHLCTHKKVTCTQRQTLTLIIQECAMLFFLFNVKYLVKLIIIACLQCERPDGNVVNLTKQNLPGAYRFLPCSPVKLLFLGLCTIILIFIHLYYYKSKSL